MCPDLEILSSYYDGELEESQREIVQKHVDSCPHCQKKLEEYKIISEALIDEEEPDFEMSQVRSWNRLMDIIDKEEYKAPKVNFWQRRFQISFPAAAALVAAFIAILSMSVVSFYMGKHTNASPSTPELNMTYNTDLNDDDLFGNSEIEFKIPDTINTIVNAREPLLIREVDFNTRNGNK